MTGSTGRFTIERSYLGHYANALFCCKMCIAVTIYLTPWMNYSRDIGQLCFGNSCFP